MAIPILLFVIAFVVRVAVAALFVEPAYPDALYYANLGRELAAGGGFSVDYIWNFVEVGGTLPAVGERPIPAHARRVCPRPGQLCRGRLPAPSGYGAG